jgi:hypothetical protein
VIWRILAIWLAIDAVIVLAALGRAYWRVKP